MRLGQQIQTNGIPGAIRFIGPGVTLGRVQRFLCRREIYLPLGAATSLMHLAPTRPPGTFAPEIGSDY